jgi:hypothetical protein
MGVLLDVGGHVVVHNSRNVLQDPKAGKHEIIISSAVLWFWSGGTKAELLMHPKSDDGMLREGSQSQTTLTTAVVLHLGC